MRMVEWKKIEDVCNVITGGDAPSDCVKGQLSPTTTHPYPVFSNGDAVYGYCANYRIASDAVTVSSIGNVGSVNYRSAHFTPIIRLKVLVPNNDLLLTKYLFYSLMDVKFIGTNSSLSSMKAADIKKIQIPVPSITEQTRIVGILDTFTASIENLKQQIAQRRKQYEHYRDQLLDLEGKDGVEMKTLGEACKIERGVRVVKKDLEENGDVPVFQNSLTPLGYYVKSNNKGGTPFVIVGGAAGDIGYSDIPFWAADDCLCINESDSVVGKYIFAVLQKKQHYLKSQVRKAGVPRLSRTVVEKLSVSIPSLPEQQRIVSILDSFEQSIANLEQQLAQREKQYEYYRNQLLTFE